MLSYDTTDQPMVGHAALEFERLSGPIPPHSATLRREGEFWTVVFEGRVCRLKDSKGLRYLEKLLCHPGAEFHVLDLVRGQYTGSFDDHEPIPPRRAPADAGIPILDARATNAYRRRLRELRDELSEAEGFNDLGRSESVRAEVEALTEQLAGAVGLGGRNRVAASASERARSTVTQRVKDAIRKIGTHAPILGDYLQRSVRTGTFCAYLPGIAQIIQWNFE